MYEDSKEVAIETCRSTDEVSQKPQWTDVHK